MMFIARDDKLSRHSDLATETLVLTIFWYWCQHFRRWEGTL